MARRGPRRYKNAFATKEQMNKAHAQCLLELVTFTQAICVWEGGTYLSLDQDVLDRATEKKGKNGLHSEGKYCSIPEWQRKVNYVVNKINEHPKVKATGGRCTTGQQRVNLNAKPHGSKHQDDSATKLLAAGQAVAKWCVRLIFAAGPYACEFSEEVHPQSPKELERGTESHTVHQHKNGSLYAVRFDARSGWYRHEVQTTSGPTLSCVVDLNPPAGAKDDFDLFEVVREVLEKLKPGKKRREWT